MINPADVHIRKARYRQFLPAALLVVAAGCTGRIRPAPPPAASPDSAVGIPAGRPVTFTATAYCSGSRTSAGTRVAEGIIAADPAIVPIGSAVQVNGLERRYNGIYTVMDTGPSVQGRQVDLYMWSCNEALTFGRRPIHLTVMRLGWNPRATTPGFFDRFLKRPQEAPLASRQLLQAPPDQRTQAEK